MASIERQGAKWRIVLRYNGQKFQRTLETNDRQEAQHLRSRVEENLKLLRRGRLEYRQGDDLVTLLLSDGKLNGEPRFEKQRTVGTLLKDYRRESRAGKEENTRYTERIHIKHLLRLLGRRTLVGAVTHKKLQEYANKRAQEKGRSGNRVSHVTIKKDRDAAQYLE